MKNLYADYLSEVRSFMDSGFPTIPCSWSLFDFTVKFCEENNLCEVFIACKFDPSAFFGFARYKAGEITLECFEKKVIPIVNRNSA